MAEKKSLDMNQLTSSLSTFYAKPVAKISLELFLSFGLVIILTVVAIQPTLTTIAQLNSEVVEKKELTSKLESKISALNSAISLYAKHQDKMHLLNESLPPTANLIPTLKIVEKLAGESNVVITSVAVPKVPDESATEPAGAAAVLIPMPISVTVMGQYQDMKRFVESLHGSRRTIQVISAGFSLEESRGERALTANFLIDAPYYGIPQ